MSPMSQFVIKIPFVLAGLALLGTAMMFLSAIPSVQTVLALAAVD